MKRFADRMVRNDVPGSPVDTVYLYMYNVTNLDGVRGGGKPHLQEIGPYVFRKMRVKQVCILTVATAGTTPAPPLCFRQTSD